MKNEEWNEDQMKILHEYCDNEMAEIKKMCNLIIMNAGGISGKEYDDIYSLAQFFLFKCVKKYDANNKKGASFKTFYRGILNRRLYATYLRDKNRQCRSNTRIDKDGNRVFLPDVSLDAPTKDCVDTLERISISPTLEDDFFKPDLKEIIKEYLNNLSDEQLEVANLFMEGYHANDIKDILHITQTEFNNRMNGMKSYRNISILL